MKNLILSNLFNYLIALSLLLFISGCIVKIEDDDDGGFCVEGQGVTVSEMLDVDEFIGINLRVDAELFVTQGNQQQVEVVAEQNIIDEIRRKVRNGIWEIEFDACVRRHETIQIFVQMQEIERLMVTGSGLIRGENVFEVGNIDLRIQGSGDIDLGLNAESIDGDISGSGKMFLEGSTGDFDFDISGSGDYRAFELSALRGDINMTGSGDSEARVANELDIRINGSGDVRYKGFPVLDVYINGSGRVINAN